MASYTSAVSVSITTQNFVIIKTNLYSNTEASRLDSQMPIMAALVHSVASIRRGRTYVQKRKNLILKSKSHFPK